MDKNIKLKIFNIFLRYFLAILSIFLLPLFYFIFRPLTIWPVYFVLSFFYDISVYNSTLIFTNASVQIIDACIAGSAFFLLLILNLITREVKIIKRVYLFLFSSFMLLFLNIIRLLIIIPLFLRESIFFDLTHKIFWYGLSTIFVVAIWILTTRIFKIKSVPLYSDIRWILNKKKTK